MSLTRKKIALLALVLIVGLGVGYGFGHLINVSQIQTLETRISNFEFEKNILVNSYNALNETYTNLLSNYTWLIQHSFTYYEVGSAVNISSLEIESTGPPFEITKVRGTITNIGGKPLERVYVYVILKHQDGTMYFSIEGYEKIENLYTGERANFEIWVYDYEEAQTVEIFLIY